MTESVRIATAGAPLDRAKAVVILVHGRGAPAESMLSLAEILAQPDVAYVAPQAPGGTWYPYSFLAPIPQNEPYLSRSLSTLSTLVGGLTGRGFASERIALIGFSQGGCLALEFAARNAKRYGAVVGLSAGLIGPENTPRDYAGSLSGTPVFLGCSNIDGHIPLERVHESTRVLGALGGAEDEISFLTSDLTVVGGKVVYGAGDFAGHDENPVPPAMPDWSPVRSFKGYAAWGAVAQAIGVPFTLMIGAAGLLAVGLIANRLKLPAGDADLVPSNHWPEPLTAAPVEHDRGPVPILIEYRIAPEDRTAFLQALQKLSSERRRNGAYAWGVSEDAADPALMLEWFMVESWAEHLRQHRRVSKADADIQGDVLRFHKGETAPVVRHFLATQMPR